MEEERYLILMTRAIKAYDFTPDIEKTLLGFVKRGYASSMELQNMYLYGLQQDKCGNTIHFNSNEFIKMNPPKIIKPDIRVVDKYNKPKLMTTGTDVRWFAASEMGWIDVDSRTKKWKILNRGKLYVSRLYSDGRNLEFTPLGNKILIDTTVDLSKIVTRKNADFRKQITLF